MIKTKDIVQKYTIKAKQKPVFVSAGWVKQVIDQKKTSSDSPIIIEVTWQDDISYKEGHLPGAILMDTNALEAPPLWNIKDPKKVEAALLANGIRTETKLILYGLDPAATARMAFIFLWAGVEEVHILNGGTKAWIAAGYVLETTINWPVSAAHFGAKLPLHPEYVLSTDTVNRQLQTNPNFRLISIRSYLEFIGAVSGYSYIVKKGEPKGAVWGRGGSSAYQNEDYIRTDGSYINMKEMLELWQGLDFRIDQKLCFYCGTGWRAAIPFLILYENGYRHMSVFDGGWLEWQSKEMLMAQIGDPAKQTVHYKKVADLVSYD